jgi:hypothetical protein
MRPLRMRFCLTPRLWIVTNPETVSQIRNDKSGSVRLL